MNDKEMDQRLIACALYENSMTPVQKTLVDQIQHESYLRFDALARKRHSDDLESHIVVPWGSNIQDITAALKLIDLVTDPVFEIILHHNLTQVTMPRSKLTDIVPQKAIDSFVSSQQGQNASFPARHKKGPRP